MNSSAPKARWSSDVPTSDEHRAQLFREPGLTMAAPPATNPTPAQASLTNPFVVPLQG